ncbi:uncharacterized protein LOC129717371 [Wyeomyia smithii]|uniref:uncharacterized protein LOC129717371 n=1 Tax=Wyeomyia smithii TaxID=174621 RepID=UPI002467D233|nr:uncharacterized protein LOC129717371 [Wyeomyia smithii]
MTSEMDIINDLPTELLCQVFDHFSHIEQNIVMRTCARWFEILTGDRYIRRRRLCLCAYNLCREGDNMEEMQRYRAFTVNSLVTNRNKNVFLEPLRRFLFNGNMAEQLEELRLTQFRHSLAQLFTSDSELLLPNLKKISFQYLKGDNSEQDGHSVKLVAPKLRIMKLELWSPAIAPMVRRFSGQIEDLSITFQHLQCFSPSIDTLSFENLRSLTLNAEPEHSFLESTFNAQHVQLFSRLTYLKLTDTGDAFYPVYKNIFQAACNLETLIIYGQDISEDAFNVLGSLEKLKELQLMIHIEKTDSVRKLSFPKLTRLKTFVGSLIPLENVPQLRILTVANHTPFRMRFLFSDAEKLMTFFGAFRQQLEVLKLDKISTLYNTFAKQICTLTKLKMLEMIDVETEQQDIEWIVGSLKQLQRAHFIRCNILKKAVEEQNDDCFHALRQRNVDCEIAYEACFR